MVSLNNEIEIIAHDSDEDHIVNLVSPTDEPTTPTKLRLNVGCILLDNRLTIPNARKDAVIDVLHATHPSVGMTELAHRLWWPFINRDLINKSKTCRPCTEFGKNLKSIIPKTKWSPTKPCVEPNEKIQIDFGGPILDGQGREVYFLACIDRFSRFPTLKLYSNANATNIEHVSTKYMLYKGYTDPCEWTRLNVKREM